MDVTWTSAYSDYTYGAWCRGNGGFARAAQGGRGESPSSLKSAYSIAGIQLQFISNQAAAFSGLPKYQADGTTEIKYTVKESVKFPGYEPDKEFVSSGGTITYTR